MESVSETSAYAERLNRRVEELVNSALGAHSETWAVVAARLGLEGAGDPSPVPVTQLEAALTMLVAEARVDLAAMARRGTASPDVVTALGMRLDRLVAAETSRYGDASVDEKKPAGGGLSSIFANVQATAAMSPWARAKEWKRQVALQCRSCGAPQRESRNFKCEYCAGDLFRRPNDEE